MKKLMMITAILAMLLVAVAPAMANHDDNDSNGVFQNSSQEAESGDVSQSFDVSQSGDNSNQCASPQGVANTGNAQNQTSLLQYGSEADDFDIDSSSSVDVSPTNTTTCTQSVNQAASAS